MLNNLGRLLETHILANSPDIEAVLSIGEKDQVENYEHCVLVEFASDNLYKGSKNDYMAVVLINVFSTDYMKALTMKRELDKLLYDYKDADLKVKVYRTFKGSRAVGVGYLKKYERYSTYNSYTFGVEDLN